MEAIAKTYAKSLFDLAVDENKVATYRSDIEVVLEVFKNNPSFVSFFNHVLIEDQKKYQLLDDSFKSSIEGYVLNFLKLLVKKRRITHIKDICIAFVAQCNEQLGIEEGIVYSSYALSLEEIAQIESSVGQSENKKVTLKAIVDETLIGGIKVQLNNRIIDASIKNKLEALKKELMKK